MAQATDGAGYRVLQPQDAVGVPGALVPKGHPEGGRGSGVGRMYTKHSRAKPFALSSRLCTLLTLETRSEAYTPKA